MKRLWMILVLLTVQTLTWAQVSVTGTSNPVGLVSGADAGQVFVTAPHAPLGFASGATTGGFDIQLAGPTQLSKITVASTGTARLRWQALKSGAPIDLWARQQDGLYDVSGNDVVADSLRLIAESSDLGTFSISSIRIDGHDPSTIAHRIIPTTVKAAPKTSFFFGPENLSDSNGGSDWRTAAPSEHDDAVSEIEQLTRSSWPWWQNWSGAYDARVDEVLPPGKRVGQVQILFGPQATGSVQVWGLYSGHWLLMGLVSNAAPGWATVASPYPNDIVGEVEVISYPGNSPIDADISEVLLWGTGNWTGDQYQAASSFGADNEGNPFGFYEFNPLSLSKPYFEFAIQGQGNTAPEVVVSGQSLGTPAPYLVDGDLSYYRVDITGSLVNETSNLLWVKGLRGTWLYGRLHQHVVDGTAAWSSTEGMLGDGWTSLPVQNTVTQFSAPAAQPGAQFQLFGDGSLQSGSDQAGWSEPTFVPTDDGKLYPNWSSGAQVKVVPGIGGVGEVKFWGTSSTIPMPQVQVLWPANGQILKASEVNEHLLVGTVSGPVTAVMVNGQAASMKGHLFWIPLRTLALGADRINTVTVSASAGTTVASQTIAVGEDVPAPWVVNVGTGQITTKDPTYTVTGQTFIDGVQVFAGGQMVQVPSGTFSLTVPLAAGVNAVPVRLVWPPTGAVLAEVDASIVSTYQGIDLSVTGQGKTVYVNKSSYDVTGTVISRGQVKLTVAGQPIKINGNQFHGTVMLHEGLNQVVVSATDGDSSVSKTVQVYLDTAIPVLSLSSPVQNSWIIKTLVVSGTVTDPAPAAVWVNGVRYTAATGSFAFTVPMLQEGQFSYQFQAENQAGTLGSPTTVGFGVDNTPPASFAITANVSGWTNNNTPTLSFATTDAVSGVGYYDYSVDQGTTWHTAVSPQKLPVLPDGTDIVLVRATDVAGNSTTQSITLQIDTTPPAAVTALRGIPGNGELTLAWATHDDDIILYHVARSPAWPEGERVSTTTSLDDSGLTNGQVYTYTVLAEDHAHNDGPAALSGATIAGLTVTPVNPDPAKGTLAEYEGLKVAIPPAALPAGTAAVLVKEISSPTLQAASTYPIVSPIYSLTTLQTASDGSLQETEHSEFDKEVVMMLDYDPTQLPNGFPETNLGVYYFDTTWGKWFKVEKSAVDTDNHKIVFTTNHFTDFSVQPTLVGDLSPQQLKDAGHSPFKSESQAGAVTVSPQGGTSMTEVTDFVLQGRNGFTLPIKRMYDSTTALGDSPSLSLSASLSFNSIASLLSVANIVAQLANQGVSGMKDAIEGKIDSMLKSNGDYALAAGVGWRLNLPYVFATNASVAVRLPSGGYYTINQMHSNSGFWTNPAVRTLDFEFHEGDDFHFQVRQVRGDVTDVVGVIAGQLTSGATTAVNNAINGPPKPPTPPPNLSPQELADWGKAQQTASGVSAVTQAIHLAASLIPGWNTVRSDLWTKDGTHYQFDYNGRVVSITDKTGNDTFTVNYDGYLLHDITDDLGREVTFDYGDSGTYAAFAKPVIEKISMDGMHGAHRDVQLHYNWNSNGDLGTFFNFLPTLSSTTDPLGRVYSYNYRQRSIVTGGGGVKINFLALLIDLVPPPGAWSGIADAMGIAALTLKGNLEINLPYTISRVVAPGIGTTDIDVSAIDLSSFDFKPTDYFLGLFPTALEVSYQIVFRLSTTQIVVTSSKGVVRTTNYDYHWDSESGLQGTQYYVSRTTIDDGRIRTVHHYSSHTVMRSRFISWDDFLVAGAQSFFQEDFVLVPEIYTLESESDLYDESGTLIEATTNDWDTDHRRLTASTAVRGDATWTKQNYTYDDWGNRTYVKDDRMSGGREQVSETWNSYIGSAKPSVWAVPDLGADEPQNNGEIHDLLKYSLMRVYMPAEAGGGSRDIAHENVYDAWGLKTHEGLWLGDHWSDTQYTYETDTSKLSFGAPTSRTGPVPGQKTDWSYDYSRNGNFYAVTQTVENVAGPVPNAPAYTVATETAYDWNTGDKLYDKDGRGYVTEYAYDLIGRVTDLTKPGSEAALATGNWTITRLNAPREHYDYNDDTLVVTVTKGVGSGVPTKVYERDSYDSLGQLIRLEKDNSTGTAQVVVTSASYTPWGEVASMTDPNGHTTSYTYDLLGHLIKTVYADAAQVTVDYDYTQNFRSTTNERGMVTLEWLNWKDQTQTKIDDYGNANAESMVYWDGADLADAWLDVLNQMTVTTYTPFGKPAQVTHPPVEVWSASAPPQVIAAPTAQTVVPVDQLSYDDAGQLVATQTGAGSDQRITTQRFDTVGRVIEKAVGPSSSARKEWTWYDDAGNVVKHADPYAVAQIIAGNLDADASSGFTVKAYSSRNQVLTESDPSGATVRYAYDDLDRKVQMKDPRSNPDPAVTDSFTLNYAYNDLDRLVSADLPPVAGQPRSTIQFTYDLRGNAVQQVDAYGRVTVWTYDTRNRKTGQTVTGSDGTGPLVTAWTYDAAGNPISETVAQTMTTTKIYDSRNRLTETDLPDGQKAITFYDDLGRVIATRDAAGYTTQNVYNSLNKLTASSDPTGNLTKLWYDVWGEATATSMQNSVGGDQVWNKSYDTFGELTAEANNAGQSWSYTYEPRGLAATVLDPNGAVTSNTYDAASRLTAQSVTKQGSAAVNRSWSYDTAGSLMGASDGAVTTQVNQAGGGFTADPYDLINSYSTRVGGKSLAAAYTYDNSHSVTSLQYPDGTTVEYQYNGLDQLTGIPGYASNGQWNALGRLTRLDAANGTGRTKTWNASTGTLDGYNWNVAGKTARNLSWDNRGNISAQAKDNITSRYYYDALNRLYSAQEGGPVEAITDTSMPQGSQINDVAGIYQLDFSHPYDPVRLDYSSTSIGVDLNSLQSVTKVRLIGVSPRLLQRNVELYISADGTLNSWTKLTDITWLQDQTGVTLQFKTSHQARYIKAHVTWDERDADNNPVDHSTLSGTVAQLVQIFYWANGQTTAWTYDSAGNRMNQYQTKGTTVLTTYSYYPNSNRIQTAGDWSFSYDANGNLTTRTNAKTSEGWNYSYDLANRLVNVKHKVSAVGAMTDVASYVYDVRGLRVSQTKAGVTTYYQYDQKGSLIWSDDSTTQTKYVEALGEPWAEVRTTSTGTTTYYHAVDHEGTTNVVTDEHGSVVWDGEYEAFGAVIRSNGTLNFTPSYTGKQYDADTGLYYYNARFYDPMVGRFLNSDPARQGNNWYRYGSDNPITHVDPNGLWDPYASDFGNDTAADAQDLVQETGNETVKQAPGAFAAFGEDFVKGFVTGQGDSFAAKLGNGVGWMTAIVDPAVGAERAALKELPAAAKAITPLTKDVAQTVAKTTKPPLALPTPKADFYVNPNGDTIPSTGYRALKSAPEDGNIMSKSGPTYVTFDNLAGKSGTEIASNLQIPYTPTAVAKFDTLQIAQDLKVPTTKWNTTTTPEPFTNSYPQFGSGGATQAITNTPISSVSVLKVPE